MKKIQKINYLIAIVALVLFAVLAFGVINDSIWVHQIDLYFQDLIRSNITENKTNIFKFITNLAAPSVAIILTIVASLISWLIKRDIRIPLFLIINVVVGAGLMAVIKQIVRRSRPAISERLITEHGFSFPSGHATNAMVFYGSLFILILIYMQKPKILKWLIEIILVLVIIAIPISRVYLGVHYPTDVLAGLLLGLFIILISTNIILIPKKKSQV